MTCAVFEAHVNEIERIKALRALMEADVAMLPHISNTDRKDWFRSITKTLLPRMTNNDVVTFNGRKIGLGKLKRVFGGIAKAMKAEDVA